MILLSALEELEKRYEELTINIANLSSEAGSAVWKAKIKEAADLEETVQVSAQYRSLLNEVAELRDMVHNEADPELHELAAEELAEKEQELSTVTDRLELLMLPPDPDAGRNAVLEIRSGAGGEEAALFASELYRMYSRYCEKNGWHLSVTSTTETELGGIKELVCIIEGSDVFSRLKYESGVHRVQRVPVTETIGRIHTSTATVAVLPELEEVEVNLSMDDIRIDLFHAGGHGGQNVNKLDTAVRLTHLPTGMVVICQDERSQLKNKQRALQVLASRLRDAAESENTAAYAEKRHSLVGTGDRSERIRTYNFPQGRVTDHRIGLTVYQLQDFLDGNMDMIIDSLRAEEQKLRLAGDKQ